MAVVQSRSAQRVVVDGRTLILFSSNDYLGLSHHPEVIAAATEAAQRYGCGAGGAPPTSGTNEDHIHLAERIAAFKHRTKGVIFPSGYAANMAIHQSLGRDGAVFLCALNHHPSAIDGIALSGCPRRFFDCQDINQLEQLLKAEPSHQCIVTIPSVFTVDGAFAPLEQLAELKKRYQFVLVLDEAHATGCVGATGRGLEEKCGLVGIADFVMGTFSKALGSQGGFLAFDAAAEKHLIRPFRSFVYSTAVAPPLAAAALKALQLLESDPEMVQKMQANIAAIWQRLHAAGLPLNPCGRHIVNVYVAPSDEALGPKMASRLRDLVAERGFFVVDIRSGQKAGLRVTAMATHTASEIDSFCTATVDAYNECVKA